MIPPIPPSPLRVGSKIVSGTSGSVLFIDSSGNLAEDNTNFFWDDANNRLGIGTNAPAYELDVNGDIRFATDLRSTTTQQSLYVSSTTEILRIDSSGNFTAIQGIMRVSSGTVLGFKKTNAVPNAANTNITFTTVPDAGEAANNTWVASFHWNSDAAGGRVFGVRGDGRTFIGADGGAFPSAKLHIQGDADELQLLVKANATQTSNYSEWQNSAGTRQASVTSDGNFHVGTGSTDMGTLRGFGFNNAAQKHSKWVAGSLGVGFLFEETGYYQIMGTTNFNASGGYENPHFLQNGDGRTVIGADAVPFTFSSTQFLLVKNPTATYVAQTIKAASAQSANIAEWLDSSDNLLVGINSAGRMAVGADEYSVTIGGAAIDATLSVHAEGATDLAEFSVHRHSDTAGFGAHFIGVRSRGSEASETVVQNNDVLLRLDALGHDGTDYEIAGQIDFEVDGTPGAGDMPGRILFKATPDGTATPVESMRVTSTEVVVNDGSNDIDFRVESNNEDKILLVDAGNDEVRQGDGDTNYVSVDNAGDMKFVGGAGLAFAGISCRDSSSTVTISGTGIANKVQITCFDTNDPSNNMTPDHTNDHITVSVAGKYLCTLSISADSVAGSSAQFGFSVWKNNGATEFTQLHAHRDLSGGAGGNSGSISISGIITLAASDTIEVWVWNETNTQNIVIDDINLALVQIGG